MNSCYDPGVQPAMVLYFYYKMKRTCSWMSLLMFFWWVICIEECSSCQEVEQNRTVSISSWGIFVPCLSKGSSCMVCVLPCSSAFHLNEFRHLSLSILSTKHVFRNYFISKTTNLIEYFIRFLTPKNLIELFITFLTPPRGNAQPTKN